MLSLRFIKPETVARRCRAFKGCLRACKGAGSHLRILVDCSMWLARGQP